MATKQDIERVIEATDIVALVSKYVKLEKNGKNYKGLCPFHNEDTPSFIVSPEKKLAHCFGCGGGGDPIKFLMQIENIDFPTALTRLAKENGIEISNPVKNNTNNSLAKYYKIMNTAVSFYVKNIENTQEGQNAIAYLEKRGLSKEIIETFKIGLSPHQGDTIYRVLKDSNYLELDMTDLGLVDKNVSGYYDMFHDRIMFPIFNENGDALGFSARWYQDNNKSQPKYINTRETILFKKGEILYNLNQAKGEILKKKRFILHEGQMDVIASYRSNLKEAICTMGTALTENQARLLKKYANNAIICYDADNAGINASRKAISIFKSLGMQVHLVLLPDKMDPDEYVMKYGEEKYLEYFESHIIDSTKYLFKTALMHKNLDDASEVEAVKTEIFALLNSINSKTEIEDYLKKAAEAIGASFEAISMDFETYSRNHVALNTIEPEMEFGGYYEPAPIYPEGPGYNPDPILVNKERWNSICEVRLFQHAKASRNEALYIDKMLEGSMEAMSPDTQSLWIMLINVYYQRYATFDEGTFIKMLNDDQVNYYIEMIEGLKYSKEKFDIADRNECLYKLKEIKCDVMQRACNDTIYSEAPEDERLKALNEKFKQKAKKDKLMKARRK